MSDEVKKEERTLKDVQQDYAKNAAKLGDLQYTKWTVEKDIEIFCNKLRELTIEGRMLNKKKEENKDESQS